MKKMALLQKGIRHIDKRPKEQKRDKNQKDRIPNGTKDQKDMRPYRQKT